eukprot:6194651-Pleurochrysis_carterae.AAC.1
MAAVTCLAVLSAMRAAPLQGAFLHHGLYPLGGPHARGAIARTTPYFTCHKHVPQASLIQAYAAARCRQIQAVECLDPVEPAAYILPFVVTVFVGFFGFNTETNRKEGPGVGRRRFLTWLLLQSFAAFSLGPQITNPCSPLNENNERAAAARKGTTKAED